ncbi:MAG TPA: adenylyltransferase/cytidyltransferase family protein, partial [Vicinamibacterales bacterium]|nr:adenylyltransferase/cytidyltransferase family protein [Vicinamibacterales bacterium]
MTQTHLRTMRFDYLVFIGRFEPFHNGHQAVIARALSLAREVIVLVGSANTPRSIRNPWNVTEREVMIRATFPQDASRLQIRPLRDHLYNDAAWINEVQHVVAGCVRDAQASKIGLIGHRKDLSSYYLEMFPQWEFVNVPNVAGVSASDLRDYLFDNDLRDEGKDLLIQAAVPSPVFSMLKGFRD